MNPAFIAAAAMDNGNQQANIDLKKAGQLTAFAKQHVVGQMQQAPPGGEQLFDDVGATP